MTWKSALGETSSPLLEGAQYQAPFHESSLIRLLFFCLGKRVSLINQYPKKRPHFAIWAFF
ncbi:hypothetical protein [Pseudomonas lini]